MDWWSRIHPPYRFLQSSFCPWHLWRMCRNKSGATQKKPAATWDLGIILGTHKLKGAMEHLANMSAYTIQHRIEVADILHLGHILLGTWSYHGHGKGKWAFRPWIFKGCPNMFKQTLIDPSGYLLGYLIIGIIWVIMKNHVNIRILNGILPFVNFLRLLIQCEAPKIAFSWFITPITMVYGTYNELVTGANLNQQTSLGSLTLTGYWPGLLRRHGGSPRPPSGFNTKSCYDDWMMTVVPLFFRKPPPSIT